MVWNKPARNKMIAVPMVRGSTAANRYRLTVMQSKRMMIDRRLKRSASLPPSNAAGKERTEAVAIMSVDMPFSIRWDIFL